jgi:hypothetical protein
MANQTSLTLTHNNEQEDSDLCRTSSSFVDYELNDGSQPSLREIHKQLKYMTRSNHSDFVKQLFSKNSVYFIGIFILLFYFHLIWMNGSPIEEFLTDDTDTDLIVFNGNNHTFRFMSDKIYYKIKRPVCGIVNVSNRLTLFVLCFDLLILFILAIIKLLLAVALFVRHYKHVLITRILSIFRAVRSARNQSSQLTTLNVGQVNRTNPLRKRQEHYSKIKCVIYVSLFSALLTLPSVGIRSLLMFDILYKNVQHDYESSHQSKWTVVNSTQLDEIHSLIDVNHNASFINVNANSIANNSLFTVSKDQIGEDFQTILGKLSTKTDNLLLIASSHKFIIMLLSCHLIKAAPNSPFARFKNYFKVFTCLLFAFLILFVLSLKTHY